MMPAGRDAAAARSWPDRRATQEEKGMNDRWSSGRAERGKSGRVRGVEHIRVTTAVLAAALSACGTGTSVKPVGEQSAFVRALRYRAYVYADGMMDFLHGGGGWIEELYFPDAGVVCNVMRELLVTEADIGKPIRSDQFQCRANAFYDVIRNRSGPRGSDPTDPRPVEELRVPAETAEAIFALAALNCRRAEDSICVGTAVQGLGLLHEVPIEEQPGFGGWETPSETRFKDVKIPATSETRR